MDKFFTDKILVEEGEFFSQKFPKRNYKKQESCRHLRIKIMGRCTCSKVLSENDVDELLEILHKIKDRMRKVEISI